MSTIMTIGSCTRPTAMAIASKRSVHSLAKALVARYNSNASPLVTFRPFSASTCSSHSMKLWSREDGKISTGQQQSRMVGTVTKKLRVLDMEVVKQIVEELRSVDGDHDERIDADDLKQLLRKHNSTFTEDEILEIGELFYAGKSGGTVSFARFVESVDFVAELLQKQQQRGENKFDATAAVIAATAKNPLEVGSCANEYIFHHNHHYDEEDLENFKVTHTRPETLSDRIAFNSVKAVRFGFDQATGWNGTVTPEKILSRAIFLETVAGVPGMVAGIVRHFRSLRNMKRDGGMMQMFLDEANNERMHLLSFVRLRNPGLMFRSAVILSQLGFGSVFLLTYIVSPKFCHRFVGYIEEEACSTYTKIIDAIESAEPDDELAEWRTQIAPAIARSYWKLGEHGTVLDMIRAVRLDEAEHRDVNHMCSTMEEGAQNPVCNAEEKLNMMLLKYVQDMMDRSPQNIGAGNLLPLQPQQRKEE